MVIQGRVSEQRGSETHQGRVEGGDALRRSKLEPRRVSETDFYEIRITFISDSTRMLTHLKFSETPFSVDRGTLSAT